MILYRDCSYLNVICNTFIIYTELSVSQLQGNPWKATMKIFQGKVSDHSECLYLACLLYFPPRGGLDLSVAARLTNGCQLEVKWCEVKKDHFLKMCWQSVLL